MAQTPYISGSVQECQNLIALIAGLFLALDVVWSKLKRDALGGVDLRRP